jgi:cell division septal protein FtsQ
MEIVKRYMFILILLLVVVVAWVASSMYFQSSEVNVNPNARSYTEPLKKSFGLEELDQIVERTEGKFPISPQDFFNLIEEN